MEWLNNWFTICLVVGVVMVLLGFAVGTISSYVSNGSSILRLQFLEETLLKMGAYIIMLLGSYKVLETLVDLLGNV